MNEQKNKNGRGIFYGVIGVATLVVAIIGATFAYFTATATAGNNVITGNMATITFDLVVTKVTHVDETKGGMIPMSNTMVEAAVANGTGNAAQTCVDDNGNAVCQVYKIEVTNTGSASLFLDGYVTLTGGSGVSTDDASATTTMRWAQLFCSGTQTDEITGCTTAGATTTGATGLSPASFSSIGNSADTTGKNIANIKTALNDITSSGTISGNTYSIIDKNFIRISKHNAEASYDRTADATSALVYNQFLAPTSGTSTDDAVVYYIVVWLAETGTNQTAGSGGESVFENANGLQFFSGNVTFNSAQGSEVTATFSSYTAVRSDNAGTQPQQSPEPNEP